MDQTVPSVTLEMIREHLYSAVVCDVLDALGYTHQSPRIQIKPLTGNSILVGRCKTTLWTDMAHKDPRPYELELAAVDGCKPDDVLIGAAGGSMRSGIWGELLSTAARNCGCVGTIIDGAVRDVAQMTQMGFACYALGTCIYDSCSRQRIVDIDVPVEMEGVQFCPGDLIIADVDGIVVIPRDVEQEALQNAWKKVHDENITRDAIVGGMKAADAYKKYEVL